MENTNDSCVQQFLNFVIKLNVYFKQFIGLSLVPNEIILNIYGIILLEINTLSCEQNGKDATGCFCFLQREVVGF